jgi:hypothetical protein
MRACSTCAHGQVVVSHAPIYGFDNGNQPPMVECRFHAPQPITGTINDNFDRITYPPLQAHDYWCGQWEPLGLRLTAAGPVTASYDAGAAFNATQQETFERLCRDPFGDQAQPQGPAPQEQVVTYDSLEDLAA